MSKVFLTGATGFLGGHVLTELKAADCEVLALSRRPDSDEGIAALGAIPVRGDLTDPASLSAAVRGCEAVFHVAGDTSVWRQQDARQTAPNAGTAGHKQLVHRGLARHAPRAIFL